MCCDVRNNDDGFYFQHIPKIVHLSVGGTGFSTSLFTLTKDDSTFFARMFSGRVPLAQDEQGRYFIDRSPAHFDIVLEYLRDGFCELPTDPAKLRQIWREADFYQLEGLKALIPPHIFTATPQMTPNNVIQRLLTTQNDELIPALDILLEFAFGEPLTALSFSRTCTVKCKIWGYGLDYVCPGRFAMMREEGYVRGPAKSVEYSR